MSKHKIHASNLFTYFIKFRVEGAQLPSGSRWGIRWTGPNKMLQVLIDSVNFLHLHMIFILSVHILNFQEEIEVMCCSVVIEHQSLISWILYHLRIYMYIYMCVRVFLYFFFFLLLWEGSPVENAHWSNNWMNDGPILATAVFAFWNNIVMDILHFLFGWTVWDVAACLFWKAT